MQFSCNVKMQVILQKQVSYVVFVRVRVDVDKVVYMKFDMRSDLYCISFFFLDFSLYTMITQALIN